MSEDPGEPRVRPIRALLAVAAMAAAGVAAFLAIASAGAHLAAPPPAGAPFGPAAGPARIELLPRVLLALIVVVLAARALGLVFRALAQPPVIGEVIAGLLLGPSALGRVAPGAAAAILPPAVAPHLAVVAQIGVILFMFLVGIELDAVALRRRAAATLAISLASMVAPFVLGVALALRLYPRLSSADVPFPIFALFLGVVFSVTAFPVLARILTDRGIQRTDLGVLALACAAVDDVTAWCLLALAVAAAHAEPGGALATVLLAAGYVALVLTAGRAVVERLVARVEREGRASQGAVAAVLVLLLASALATERIGIHAVFGAFALGAVIPPGSRLARELAEKLEDLVVVLLLPAFFAVTGLRTEVGLLSGPEAWLTCGLICAVASAGKVGGTLVAARACGMPAREAACLGVLMNTRGLMELVVLDIGLDLRVISPLLFAMLVLMAVATTLATAPALHLLTRGRRLRGPALAPAPGA